MVEKIQYQRRLVESIQTRYHSVSEQVLQAFLTIPRHPFIQHYYLHQPGTRDWTRHEQEESPVWYEQIYSDQALVTSIDEHGRSLSSSSQPGVMAAMLDALELHPGMRVLEIGTGTGYNAALVAFLVGDPRLVTTLDIDSCLIERARPVISKMVGEGMTLLQADGIDGSIANTPYDRILVTASSSTIPYAWMKQLAPDGMLVCVLQPGFAMLGGLLKAQKKEEKLKGSILSVASFMVLHNIMYTKRTIQTDFRAPLYASFPLDLTLFQPYLIRENTDFAFFLYYDVPDLYVFQKGDALIFSSEAAPQGYVLFRQSPALLVELRGDRSLACILWNRLVRAYSLWIHCGRPAITQYQFEMDADSQSLAITLPSGTIWPFVMRRES
jgi:protein-L-isoaspartate(D-aspartate) O-methyltransferase